MWLDEENGKYMSDPTWEYVDAAYQKALDTLEESSNGYYPCFRNSRFQNPRWFLLHFPR